MKKTFILITFFSIFAFLSSFIILNFKNNKTISSPVSENGKLKLENKNIVNKNGDIFTLKGISSSGIQWTYEMLTYENLKSLKENFDINAFRIAMYTEENGYISNPDFIYEKILNITDILIDLDLYIIIDWHILNDGDPNIHIKEAKEFFDKYSKKYKNSPNILYEICNEPNGTTVTWNDSIKPYAETIIPTIRKNNPDSLIIVGTPHWCTKFSDVHENPLDFKNILYSCHYYAGTYLNDIKDNIEIMKEKNLPVIVTETGLTDKTGDGKLYYDEFNSWINYLHKENISWFYWSFSNTSPSSSILKEDYKVGKNILNYLNDSGKYLLNRNGDYSLAVRRIELQIMHAVQNRQHSTNFNKTRTKDYIKNRQKLRPSVLKNRQKLRPSVLSSVPLSCTSVFLCLNFKIAKILRPF